MSKGSVIRQLKRKAMREGGCTFAERAKEAMRVGMPIRAVKYSVENKVIKAVKA